MFNSTVGFFPHGHYPAKPYNGTDVAADAIVLGLVGAMFVIPALACLVSCLYSKYCKTQPEEASTSGEGVAPVVNTTGYALKP